MFEIEVFTCYKTGKEKVWKIISYCVEIFECIGKCKIFSFSECVLGIKTEKNIFKYSRRRLQ